jgi:23S rRNA (cytidine1920-2'-O)/16S rRNA (cytidine1409-2'-O)-methyltransferase
MVYTSAFDEEGHAVSATQRKEPRKEKARLDQLLLERGLAETRQKAQALILAGRVTVDGKRAEKSGTLVKTDAAIDVLAPAIPYVGRGGVKLQAALDELGWDVTGLVALDIGSSTGGFVDCLLQRGASRIIAVDVGTAQLDWRLRHDPRVRVLEQTNARYITRAQVGEHPDLITIDVSFISVTQILPAMKQLAQNGTRLLVLVKPQFEVGRQQVGKGGIVRDPALHRQAVAKVSDCAAALGFRVLRDFPSAILGAEGNQEFFLAAASPSPSTTNPSSLPDSAGNRQG